MDKTLEQIITEVGQRPMRSSIITAAALIDSMLGKVIEKYLIDDADTDELFSHQGCLGTFSSKIQLAYALGLISKELHDDINLFRKIRNRCAHDIAIDDETRNYVKSIVGNFKMYKKVFKAGKNEDLLIYTGLEFSVIFICLIKRYNNVNRLTAFPCEVHDDYLAFNDSDNEFLSRFGEVIK